MSSVPQIDYQQRDNASTLANCSIPNVKFLTTDNLAPASAAPQKTIALAANDYTPPASLEPETETTTPALTTENLQSTKNVKLSKSKLNPKLTALPADVKKSTEPR